MTIDQLLQIAVASGASDLHLKVGTYPMMRVRGTLVPASGEKKLDHEDVIAMSAAIMSTTQRQKFKEAQEVDLAYSVAGLGRFRCNIFQQRGTVGMVLRIIPMQIRTIDELGLPPVLKQIAEEERGLVLVTGTTGSGKSTTLAGMIDYVNKTRSAHVMTVEDPIEFLHRDNKSMVNQREVAVDTRSFAHALRSALRQDPDVILVGETRDLETAQIGIRAALTGHLVLTTLHTNDCPSTVARLLDMGIPPFLVSSSLMLILAQRLGRRVCKDCKQPYEADEETLVPYGHIPQGLGKVNFYKGKGCATCNFTGMKGRVAIYEVMPATQEIRDLIIRNAPSVEIGETAQAQGMKTLRQNALQKVLDGMMTVEEVLRVTLG